MASDQSQLGRQILHQHRHDVGDDQHPHQQVAIASPCREVRGDVPGIDIRHGRDEGRAHQAYQSGTVLHTAIMAPRPRTSQRSHNQRPGFRRELNGHGWSDPP